MTNPWIGLISLALFASSTGTAGSPKNVPAIACAKDSASRHASHQQEALLADEILPAVEEVRPLPSGYAFRLPARGDLLVKVAGWVTEERKCCGFLTFVMRLDAGEDALWLELTGPEGSQEILASTFLPPLAARRVAGAGKR